MLAELPKREQPYLDILFPSDNEYNIPVLDLERQPTGIDLHIHAWGEKGRKHEKTGLVHFYVDDYRFNAIWNNPKIVSDNSFTSAVEPNITTSLDSPIAWVIWATYQKRWIAKYWQTQGLNIWVDLNIPSEFQSINLLGIPNGWNAFMTKGYTERIEALKTEFEIAQFISGKPNPLFAVHGGGKTVKELCLEHGWFYLAENQDRAKGKVC